MRNTTFIRRSSTVRRYQLIGMTLMWIAFLFLVAAGVSAILIDAWILPGFAWGLCIALGLAASSASCLCFLLSSDL